MKEYLQCGLLRLTEPMSILRSTVSLTIVSRWAHRLHISGDVYNIGALRLLREMSKRPAMQGRMSLGEAVTRSTPQLLWTCSVLVLGNERAELAQSWPSELVRLVLVQM